MNTRRLFPILIGLVVLGLLGTGLNLSSASARECGEARLVLVKDGVATSTIVVADDADWWQRQAAKWVQDYVARATGAKLPIVPESKAGNGTMISVGHTKLAKKARVTTKGLKWDGCRLVVKKNVLFLIGRDSTGIGRDDPSEKEMASFTTNREWHPDSSWNTHGADKAGANGTCKAVVTFLEDVCGVRWFLPFRQGEIVPKTKDLSVGRDLNKEVTPAFAYVNGAYAFGSPRLSPAAFANNHRFAVRMRTYGGHSWYISVPSSLFAEHPEYFAMMDGKRTAEGNHLCMTNEDVKDLMVKSMRDLFDEGYEWVQLGQSDGWKPCTCDACEAADTWSPYNKETDGDWWKYVHGRFKENPCERLLSLHNEIIKEVSKSHPDKIVHLLVYGPTRWPAKNAKYPQTNVVAEVCNGRYPKSPEAWRDKVKALTVYRYWWDVSWVHGYRPTVSPKEMREQLVKFSQNNIIGIFLGGEPSNYGLNGPVFYTLGRLASDPSLDENKVVKEYCLGLYGEAGEEMLRFFEYLYDRPLYNLKYAPHTPHGEVVRNTFPPRVIARLEKLLAEAEAKTASQRVKDLVQMTRYQFDYLKLVTNMWVAYEAYQVDGSRENILDLQKHVDAFEEYRKMILSMDPDVAQETFPDWGWLCKWLTKTNYWVRWTDAREKVDIEGVRGTQVGYYAKIGEPITLDFDALLKSAK